MKKTKKVLSILLAVLMLLSAVPLSGFVGLPYFEADAETAYGDVDRDGRLTASDARLILRQAVGKDATDAVADVFADGKITAEDARYVLRASIALEDDAAFPVTPSDTTNVYEDASVSARVDWWQEDESLFADLYLTSAIGVTSWDFDLTFDSEVLEFSDFEDGTVVDEFGKTKNNAITIDVGEADGDTLKTAGYMRQAMLTQEEFAADAKSGQSVEIDPAFCHIASLYFDVTDVQALRADGTVFSLDGSLTFAGCSDMDYSYAAGQTKSISQEVELIGCSHENTRQVDAVAQTCTTDGYTAGTYCEYCETWTQGHTLIEATGHVWGDTMETVLAPTCETDGIESLCCTVCKFSASGSILCDVSTYPESAHNYANDANDSQTFSYPGAQELILKFSDDTETESSWDYIYLYNADNVQIGKYTGTELKSKEITVAGDSFKIKLTSDSSSTEYGYRFESIHAKFVDEERSNVLPALNPEVGCVDADGDDVCDACNAQMPLVANGYCGNNVRWTLYEDGLLRIFGTGDMHNFSWSSIDSVPWENCKSDITSVVIEDGVTSIGDYAFYYCSNMQSILLADSITRIGEHAFEYCSAVKSITVSDGVTQIGESAFFGCSALASVAVGENNANYSVMNGVLYNKDKSTLICYPAAKTDTSFTVPDSVKEIGIFAFNYCNALTSVQFGDNSRLQKICSYAFENCRSLSQITFPNSLKIIEDSVFDTCNSFTQVVLPYNIEKIGYYAFNNWYLESITIANPTCEIYDSSYTINSSATIIGFADSTAQAYAQAYERTFEELVCDHADEREFAAVAPTCTEVGYTAGVGCVFCGTFSEGHEEIAALNPTVGCTDDNNDDVCDVCSTALFVEAEGTCGRALNWKLYEDGLLKVYGTGRMYNYSNYNEVPWADYRENIKTVQIATGVLCIGANAFYDCCNLESVRMSNSVVSIGYRAFSDCSSLKNVVIGQSVAVIGSCAFGDCSALESISIPNSVTTIGSEAFSWCSELAQVHLGTGIKTVESGAFNNCSSLESINLPASLTTIEDNTFYGCYALATIALPENLTTIGYSAFAKSGLTQISIPDSVTDIGYAAFNGCSSLASVHIPAGVCSISSKAFSHCDSLAQITVDAQNVVYCAENSVLYDKDKTTVICYPCGKQDKTYTAPDTVTVIEEYAFAYNSHIESVALPDAVSRIKSSAFRESSALVSISGATALEEIESSVFYYCTSLAQYTIPESVTYIGDSAFYNCDALENMTVPVNVSKLSYSAFGSCDSLASVTVLNPECSIGNGAIPGNAEVKGYTGSTAERYAEDNGRTFTALVCSHVQTEEHSAVAPTCTQIGYTAGVYCLSCDMFISGHEEVAATGHTPGEEWMQERAATCLNSGLEIQPCAVCGESITELVQTDSQNWPESEHNYASNEDDSQTFYHNGAKELILQFSANTYTERGCDYITILDENDDLIGEYSGSALASAEIVVPGSSFTINFTSDYSSEHYGYSFDSIEAVMYDETYIRPTEAVSPETPCADADGDDYCDVCGISLTKIQASGYCGESVQWKLYGDGTLKVYGNGAMEDFESYYDAPWREFESGIRSIEIEEGVISVGNYAFMELYNAQSVSLASTVTSIGSYAFADCYDVDEIFIPSGVTSIGSYAFKSCSCLQEIVLPAGITVIADAAFSYCYSLKSITFQGNVTAIGDAAFSGCSYLASVTIPETVRTIGEGAFRNCDNLQTVTVPAAVVSIGDGVFEDCDNVSAFVVNENNTVYSSLDGVLYNKDRTKLIAYPCAKQSSSFTVPETVTEIGECAFSCCNSLISVTVPRNVKVIGADAFFDCYNLKTLSLTSGLYMIMNRAFASCYNLEKVTIPETVLFIGDFAFKYSNRLREFTVLNPNCVLGSQEEDFYNDLCNDAAIIYGYENSTIIDYAQKYELEYSLLEGNASVPEPVKTDIISGPWGEDVIWTFDTTGTLTFSGTGEMAHAAKGFRPDWYAFKDCIKSIVIENGVTNAGSYVFADHDKVTSVTLADSVVAIGQRAFENCVGITEFSVFAAVESIGEKALLGCSALTAVNVNANNANYKSVDGVLYDKAMTELICYPAQKAGTAFEVPASVTSIAPYACSGAAVLETLTFAESEESVVIGEHAFSDSTALKSVILSENVTSLAFRAFAFCEALESITVLNPDCAIYDKASTIYESAVIHGYDDSTVQAYALNYERTFESLGTYIPPEEPSTDPEEPSTNPDEPSTDPEEPSTSPEEPSTDPDKPVHQHSYSKVVTAPTVATGGYTTYTCACGDSYIADHTDPIPTDNAFVTEEKELIGTDNTKVETLLQQAGVGAVIKKKDGTEKPADEKVGTGDTLILPDGKEIVISVLGDIDGDGDVATADARLALRKAVGLEQFDTAQEIAAKVDGGLTVAVAHARSILRAAVGLEKTTDWFRDLLKK